MSPELTRIVPLAYFSKSLSPAQSLWPPFRQEHYAQLLTRRFMRAQFGSIPTILYTDHQNLVRLQDAPLDRIDPVAYRINAELTQDGSELRNLAGRTIRIADGLSRSTLSKELSEERQHQLRSLLEARTQEMQRLQALLKDENNDFFYVEPDMVGKIAAEDYGLTLKEGPAEVPEELQLVVTVLVLPPYLLPEAADKEQQHLELALTRKLPGYRLKFKRAEPPFEEAIDGTFFWMSPYARQATETKKRYRKQVLASIVTVLRIVGRVQPDFIAGIQQGGMIAALLSNPLILEVAARQRVATDAELSQLRAAWPRIRGILAVRPFVTVAHSTIERLLEALPELTGSRRILTCAIVCSSTATERKFAEGLAECLGGRIIPADLAGLNWHLLMEENALVLPWHNEGCIACGKKAQLTRCHACGRPLHLTCAVNRKQPGEPPVCLNCHAADKAMGADGLPSARPVSIRPWRPQAPSSPGATAGSWEALDSSMVNRVSPMASFAMAKTSDEIFRTECAILASMPPALAARAQAEAELAEESMKDKIPAPARKELNRELGDSRTYEFETFVPTTLRQKAVQECFEEIIEKWSEVPVTPQPPSGRSGAARLPFSSAERRGV